MTKGAFCHHFASKEALGVALAEWFSCVAGTMVQEAFGSSEPIRAACNSSILDNAAALEDDLAAAIDQSGARGVTAASLARHIQAVIRAHSCWPRPGALSPRHASTCYICAAISRCC